MTDLSADDSCVEVALDTLVDPPSSGRPFAVFAGCALNLSRNRVYVAISWRNYDLIANAVGDGHIVRVRVDERRVSELPKEYQP